MQAFNLGLCNGLQLVTLRLVGLKASGDEASLGTYYQALKEYTVDTMPLAKDSPIWMRTSTFALRDLDN